MKIGICDDIRDFCDALERTVQAFVASEALDAQVVKYTSGAALLADEKPCDILFLDMELGDVTGIEVLEALKQRRLKTIVLVVTAYAKYIDNALDYNILRYLKKPVEQERIFAALKKAVSVLNEDYIVIYDLKTKAKYKLALREIICAETKLRKIYVYSAEQTYYLKEGFKSFKSALKASYFAEAHYSYVVNMNYIKCFKRMQIVLDIGGQEKNVPVSGDKQAQLRKKYAAFLGEDDAI